MAAELLGGNAIGAVFGGLVKVIENVTKKALVFKTKLKQIQETLESNSPILNEIKQLDERLDRRNEQIEKIMEVIRNGETLVLECSKIRWYHCWRRPKYTDKLIELERSINQFFQTVMPAQIARGNREILVEVRSRKGPGSNGTIDGLNVSCAVPESLVCGKILQKPLMIPDFRNGNPVLRVNIQKQEYYQKIKQTSDPFGDCIVFPKSLGSSGSSTGYDPTRIACFTPSSSMAPPLFAVACELDGIYDPSDKRRIPCDVKLKELFDIDCSKTLFRSFCEGLTVAVVDLLFVFWRWGGRIQQHFRI
ncbi:hypothetical protein D5086_014760 [Populus alba]|uniref:Uncharacterized protein n=1 Tax=Populus alba TaxID=43335 RepID=A0ACC4BYW2_POPAL